LPAWNICAGWASNFFFNRLALAPAWTEFSSIASPFISFKAPGVVGADRVLYIVPPPGMGWQCPLINAGGCGIELP
jgi:hypothetical protein